MSAAFPLLNAIAHIRHATAPEDPAGLRQRLIDEVRRFEQACQRLGVANEVVIAARYCLCTSLDEAAALTQWGQSDIWAGNGLLVTFHNETSGGEKFFQLLATLLQEPSKHADLLELIEFCLLLGFGGRYRVMENGIYRLEIITQRLSQQLRKVRGEYAAPLSQLVNSPDMPRRSARAGMALVLSVLLCGLTSSAIFIGLDQLLDHSFNQVQEHLYSMPLPKAPPPLNRFSLDELRKRFKDPIAAGEMTVLVQDEQVVVSLRGGDLFGSASARLNERYHSLLHRLARLLVMLPGPITVLGYSDDQKIRTSTYPSNQALSLARAEAVADQLRACLRPSQQVIAKSVADAAPLLPNTTATNRAINRRVDIVFPMTAPSGVAGRGD
jgi:type VI secretion system protein ImpK